MSDRAERLRSRRNQSKQSDPSEASEPDKPSETEPEQEDDLSDGDSESVKDEREGTYMYLPESQKSEINLAFKRVNLKYEEETGEELEKNRHFYPLLIQEGLDGLDGLDGKDIKDCLDGLDL